MPSISCSLNLLLCIGIALGHPNPNPPPHTGSNDGNYASEQIFLGRFVSTPTPDQLSIEQGAVLVSSTDGKGFIKAVAWNVSDAMTATSALGVDSGTMVVTAGDNGFFFPGFIGMLIAASCLFCTNLSRRTHPCSSVSQSWTFLGHLAGLAPDLHLSNGGELKQSRLSRLCQLDNYPRSLCTGTYGLFPRH